MTRPVAPGLVLVFLITAAAVPALGIPVTAGGPAAAGPPPDAFAGPDVVADEAALSGPVKGVAAKSGVSVDPTVDRGSRSVGIEGPLQDQTFDRTEFHITVYTNGSARWRFLYRKNLQNGSEVEQFKAFAQEFNTNETELYQNFKSRAEGLAAQGTNVTDRQMEARDFRRSASVRQLGGKQGIVEMSFLWTNFAKQTDNGVLVSDVFEGGLYLGSNQVIYFYHGPDLRFQEGVQPPPDANQSAKLTESQWILYEGERQFLDGQPYVPLTTSDNGGTDGSSGDGPGPGTSVPPDGLGLLPFAVLALVVLLGLGAAVVYRSGALSSSGSASGPAGAEAAAAGDGDGDGGATATEPAVSDEELLSDEDRVLQLLDEHGGRMKQVNIVEETGWSKSKVSMLLSDMEDAEQISKLRVGRENIISLKGEEPDAAGSPFEDED